MGQRSLGRSLVLLTWVLGGATALSAQAPHFDPVAATNAYLATFNGAARARSDAYFEGGYWIILWNALVSFAIAWGLLHFGFVRRLSDWSARVSGGRMWLRIALFALIFQVATVLIALPWSLYTDWWRERHYGLSTQGVGQWLGDQLKIAPISLLLMAVLLMIVLPLYWRRPRSWWVWGTGVCALFFLFIIVLAPVAVVPLLNKSTPMPAGPLREQILSMARANGVPTGNVYVVDASRQTTRISANVSGLGPTIRISLNDNLLRRAAPAEVRSVMGHELGHYVLRHMVSLLIAFTLLSAFCLVTLHLAVPALVRRYGTRWGVEPVRDPGLFAIVALAIAPLGLVLTPIVNNVTRFHERQADYFGINASRAPDGFARAALHLGEYRKLEPTPLEEFLMFDHPSGRSRILMAMRWKAEHLGEPGVE